MSQNEICTLYDEPFFEIGMSDERYNAIPAGRSTTIKKYLNQTPAKIAYDLRNTEQASKPAYALGSAVHKKVLTPQHLQDELAVMDTVDGRTKAGKAYREQFYAENSHKVIITEEQDIISTAMAVNIANDPIAAPMLSGASTEVAIVWQHGTGYLLKVKADAIPSGENAYLIDIKTTTAADFTSMAKTITKFGYDVSAAMYLEGANKCPPLLKHFGVPYFESFVLICIENEPPYQVACYELSSRTLEIGFSKYDVALRRLLEAEKSANPIGYPPELRVIDLPPWADRIDIL